MLELFNLNNTLFIQTNFLKSTPHLLRVDGQRSHWVDGDDGGAGVSVDLENDQLVLLLGTSCKVT
jgi:hypothetical protein